MPENHAKNPSTIYGISKLAGEKYCMHFAKEFGLKVSVLRYFHVYGPRQDYSGEAGVVSIFLSRVLNKKPPVIFSGGNQIRCFTYVADDVDATLLLAKEKKAIGEDYNVASKARVSINELAGMAIDKYAEDKSMKPIYGKARSGENMKPIPDTAKIEALGFKAKLSFEKGLELTKKWVAEQEGK
jgi:UDP-glucose 4-epimerase